MKTTITSPLGFELAIGDRTFRADSPRGIVADCLDEAGRDHEARLLRTTICVAPRFSRRQSAIRTMMLPVAIRGGRVVERKSRSADQRYLRVKQLSDNGRYTRTFHERSDLIPASAWGEYDSLQLADMVDGRMPIPTE